jgi:hypothetical protein
MKLPFFSRKPKEEKKEETDDIRQTVASRLATIKKSEKNEKLKDHEVPDLVEGLADGDG